MNAFRIPGPQLFEFVCQSGQYDECVVQKFMKQLFEALTYLHSREIAHLDIKVSGLLKVLYCAYVL